MDMPVVLKPVLVEEKEILRNLLEKYLYEFTQYNNTDINKLGLYGYPYLDFYWNTEDRWPYFIMAGEHLAGFVLVNSLPIVAERQTNFQIAEFFVLHKYRRSGVGKTAFFLAAARHKGKWQLKCHPKNSASVLFWHKAVAEFTKGNFELAKAYPGIPYEDGSPPHVYFFTS